MYSAEGLSPTPCSALQIHHVSMCVRLQSNTWAQHKHMGWTGERNSAAVCMSCQKLQLRYIHWFSAASCQDSQQTFTVFHIRVCCLRRLTRPYLAGGLERRPPIQSTSTTCCQVGWHQAACPQMPLRAQPSLYTQLHTGMHRALPKFTGNAACAGVADRSQVPLATPRYWVGI